MRVAEADIGRVFQASLWLKGMHSLAEVIAGTWRRLDVRPIPSAIFLKPMFI